MKHGHHRRGKPFFYLSIQCCHGNHFFPFIDSRRHDIGPISALNFFFHLSIRLRPQAVIYHPGDDGLSLCRSGPNHGKIHISVHCGLKRPRNRRCGHDQHVRNSGFLHQQTPLIHTKSMLLVGNHQFQVLKNHILLDDGMRSHHHIGRALLNFLKHPLLLRCTQSANEQNTANPQRLKILRQLLMMLPRQNLCGRHERTLSAGRRHPVQRRLRHRRLTAAHISLNQPIHRS